MVPEQLVADFWEQVAERLEREHHRPRGEALAEIQRYRERLAAHGVTDLLYHSSPGDIAKAIAGGGYQAEPPAGRRES
jgi:hypothetical protein